MSAGLPHIADIARCGQHGRKVPIVLQKSPSKLCEMKICNNRIGAPVLLSRCCAFMPNLESMFRDKMPKILLQQYLPKPLIAETAAEQSWNCVRAWTGRP
jgi:hypothetical protein